MYEDRRAFSNYSVEEMGLGWVRLEGGISFDIEETWAVHHDGQEASKILGSKGGLRLDPLTYFSSIADMPASSTFDLKASDTRWHACSPDTAWYDSSQQHWVGALLGRVPLLPTAEYRPQRGADQRGHLPVGAPRPRAHGRGDPQASKSMAIDPYTPEKVWK